MVFLPEQGLAAKAREEVPLLTVLNEALKRTTNTFCILLPPEAPSQSHLLVYPHLPSIGVQRSVYMSLPFFPHII